MAYVEGSQKTFTAGAALTRFTAVKLNASGQVIPSAAATDETIGVVHQDVASGNVADVRLKSGAGTLNITAGGAIAAGDAVTVNASALAVTASAAAAGAVPTTRVLGIAVKAAASGALVELIPSTARI